MAAPAHTTGVPLAHLNEDTHPNNLPEQYSAVMLGDRMLPKMLGGWTEGRAMTTKNRPLRDAILATMVRVGRDALESGRDPWRAIAETFPGTPGDVIAAAWAKATDEDTEAWWQQVERTLDVEVVANAVAKVSAS